MSFFWDLEYSLRKYIFFCKFQDFYKKFFGKIQFWKLLSQINIKLWKLWHVVHYLFKIRSVQATKKAKNFSLPISRQ